MVYCTIDLLLSYCHHQLGNMTDHLVIDSCTSGHYRHCMFFILRNLMYKCICLVVDSENEIITSSLVLHAPSRPGFGDVGTAVYL